MSSLDQSLWICNHESCKEAKERCIYTKQVTSARESPLGYGRSEFMFALLESEQR